MARVAGTGSARMKYDEFVPKLLKCVVARVLVYYRNLISGRPSYKATAASQL